MKKTKNKKKNIHLSALMVVETGIDNVDNTDDSETGDEKDWMLLYEPTGCWKEEESSSWSPNA